MCKFPFFFEFPLGHLITVGFCEVNFPFFDKNFYFKPLIQAFCDARHTNHTKRCPSQASQSIYMKKSCPASRVIPPAEVRTRPPETTQRHSYKRLFEFYKDKRKSQLALGIGNSGGGFSRVQRPYKWGLTKNGKLIFQGRVVMFT